MRKRRATRRASATTRRGSAGDPTVTRDDLGAQSYSGPTPGVHALLAVNGRLYVGGSFLAIGGTPRTNLAVFEADGSLGSWNPVASKIWSSPTREVGSVRALASDGATVWVGGDFENMSGISHRAVAAFDASGALQTWTPGLTQFSAALALAIDTDRLYVGGYLEGLGSDPRGTGRGLAVFDRTGALIDWRLPFGAAESAQGPNDPPIGRHEFQVNALAAVGDTLYVGGEFSSLSGVSRANLAALDKNGHVLDRNPSIDGVIYALAAQGSTLYAGGAMRILCAEERNGLAAIDRDGKLLDWDPPSVGGRAQAMALGQQSIYIESEASGQRKSPVAEIRLSDGIPTGFAPQLDLQPSYAFSGALQVFKDTLYVGAGNSLAAVSRDGSVLPWSPLADSEAIAAMTVMGDTLYVGGSFTPAWGAQQQSLVAFTADGKLLSWAPNPDGPVTALLSDAETGRLYVGGRFTSIAGANRAGLAAFDSAGRLLAWNPGVELTDQGTVRALAKHGQDVIVAGGFRAISGISRNGLAAVDQDGRATPWNPHAPALRGLMRMAGAPSRDEIAHPTVAPDPLPPECRAL